MLYSPARLTPSHPPHPDLFVRLGGWLFRHRTSLPLPIAAVLFVVPAETSNHLLPWIGGTLVVAAELLRLWAVRHIGAISRTRSDRLGPLVDSGPFALVRNPLYLANIGLWVGFALSARLPWLAPVLACVLAIEYHAIVRWEEQLLESRFRDDYRAYAARVPRWMSVRKPRRPGRREIAFPWRDAFFSERGTLMAIAAGFLLLWMRSQR